MKSLTKSLSLIVGVCTSLAGGTALAQAEETMPAEDKAAAEAKTPGAEASATVGDEAQPDAEAKAEAGAQPEAGAQAGATAQPEAGAQVEATAQPEAEAAAAAPAEPEVTETEVAKEEESAQKVLFDFDSATLTAEGKKEVFDLAKEACADRKEKVTIEGHADQIGDAKYNAELSLRRAEAVRDELERNGIERGRIETVVFGELKPVVDGPADIDIQEPNRRVALYLGGPEAKDSDEWKDDEMKAP